MDPVVVIPDILSKKASLIERFKVEKTKGMLPKNTLGREMFKKLKVVIGSEHPYISQKPISLDI